MKIEVDTPEWYAVNMAFILCKVDLLTGYVRNEDNSGTIISNGAGMAFVLEMEEWARRNTK